MQPQDDDITFDLPQEEEEVLEQKVYDFPSSESDSEEESDDE